MYKNGGSYVDLYVQYDPEKTAQVRENWDNEYVNCYKDANGDYLYAQDISLKSLTED
jgi:hypothetical protein